MAKCGFDLKRSNKQENIDIKDCIDKISRYGLNNENNQNKVKSMLTKK